MQKTTLLPVLFLIFSFTANAQITIPESAFTDMFGTDQESTTFDLETSAALETIVSASGAGQMWDFRNATMIDTFSAVLRYIPLPADVPGNDKPEFADAAFVESIMDDGFAVYIYYALQNGELIEYGSTSVGDQDDDGVDDEFSTYKSPPSVQEVFPIAFGNTWTDSTSTLVEGVPFATDVEITDTSVDGWGTLITSEGSFDALRTTLTARSYNPMFPMMVSTFINIDFTSIDGVTANISLDGNGNIVAASYSVSGGMVGTDTEDLQNGLPSAYQLSQNFPNPFNPSTRISYAIPETSDVRLTVYSMTGRKVATLVNGTRAAGSYDVSFDATDLASGVYLYRLETSGFTQNRLMNLIK